MIQLLFMGLGLNGNFMTLKELKEFINDIPDNYDDFKCAVQVDKDKFYEIKYWKLIPRFNGTVVVVLITDDF
jgi:hypothetical protein